MAIAETISTKPINLQTDLFCEDVIIKYSNVSSGTDSKSRSISASDNDTKNTVVGVRNLPCIAHVAITTQLPIIPIKNVNV